MNFVILALVATVSAAESKDFYCTETEECQTVEIQEELTSDPDYKMLGEISLASIICASVSGLDKGVKEYDDLMCVPDESCGMSEVEADETTWYINCPEGAAKIFLSAATAFMATIYAM